MAVLIVAAALAWYAETPATLERMARSLGGVADVLVALGGRWDKFPEVLGDDPVEQAAALIRGCEDADVFCEVSHTGEVFESQVEKRADLMATARAAGDWVFVIDADEYVADANTDAIAVALEMTRADAATVHGIRVPSRVQARRPWRRMYRSSTGVTVEVAHNGYRTADGRWLYGDPAHVQLEPAVDLTDHLLLIHDLQARDETRLAARREYLQARRDQQFEAWPAKVTA